MQITFIGHAGLYVETRHGSILCDPWFNPAYFASWIPFPDNSGIDPATIGNPTYLYLSHVHHDHFDPVWLRDHVSKETTVILPDHPLPLVERYLRDLGFTQFIQTQNAVPLDLDGLRVMTTSLVSPADGPLGDSGLSIDDGEVRIFDQNDSRPVDFDALTAFGPYDAHFLQFSGAIWYPMVYRFPEAEKRALGRQKRVTQMARAVRYARQIGAPHIVPMAGPPCFLDDDLFHFNDFDRDPVNIFPDQSVFLDFLQEQGYAPEQGHLMIPGSVMTLTPESCTVQHELPDDEVSAIFTDKRAYLEQMRERRRPEIEAEKATWTRGEIEILPVLKEWFEPLIQQADRTAEGINTRVLLNFGEAQQSVVLDFRRRRVRAWHGETCEYRLFLDPALVETCIKRGDEDWVNQIFLSCRFAAERDGPYNEYVYSFFKCLTPERIQYAEGFYSEQQPEQEMWECGGYRIQRRCPHLKADLTRFGQVEDGILTCTLHGWQFDIATGKCLTSDDKHLRTEPIAPNGATSNGHGENCPAAVATLTGVGGSVRGD
ncbi:MAG: UDP-MurNAc hydroxylase [Thermomicrobiales bacterium]|nr:UDP-MurNAc hydroxylase [Thermomicrobiales bacterium]